MKATFITLLTVFVLAIGALLIGPSFVDWSKYKDQAQDQIKAHTGYDVEIGGDLSLALIPAPRFSVEDVRVNVGDDQLASLARLDVHLDALPLLSKKIVVKSLDLVKPDMAIAVLSNGTQNWMTTEIQTLMSKDKPAAPKSEDGGLAQNISLQGVSIEDGRFSYRAGAGKASVEVSAVNADIEAATLQGPFEIDGDLVFGAKPLAVQVEIGKLEAGAQDLAVKAEGDYAGLAFSYGGSVGLAAPFESQGKTAVAIKDLGAYLNNPGLAGKSFKFGGLLTGSTEKVAVKGAEISAMEQIFRGDIEAGLKPLSLSADLTGQDTLNIDQLLPKGESQGGGDITKVTEALPKTLTLPAGFELRLNASVPAAIFNGQTFSGVDATVTRVGQSLKANVKVKAPGGADVTVKSDLSFGSKSVSQKTGSEILADPSMSILVKASAPNVAATAKALSGKGDLPYISAAKTGDFDVAAAVKPGLITLSPSTVRLDSQTYKLSGSLKGKTLVANIGAFGGQLIVKGDLRNDLGPTMQLGNMAVQVKHSSLPKAVKTLTQADAVNPMLSGPVDFYTEVEQDGQAFKLSNIKAKILNTSMTGALRYDGAAGKPSVSGDITFGDLVIPSKGGSPAAKGGAGQWSKDKIDTAFLHGALADLAISANSITFEKWDIAKPSLAFKLSPGVLNVSELKAGLFSGQLNASANVNAGANGPLSVTSNFDMANVQIEKLVDALAGNKLVKGSGVVSLKGQVSTTGSSQSAMINALGGSGTTSGSNLVLEGFDLAKFTRALSGRDKLGSSAAVFLQNGMKGGSTNFDTMNGAYTIDKGIVTLTALDLDGAAASVASTGTIDLPKWYLNTTHTLSVKSETEDVPPFTVDFKGPLNKPAQTFGQGAFQNYLQSKINDQLQKFLGDKLGGGDSGKSLTGNDALDGILGGVLGVPTQRTQEQQQAPANDNVLSPAGEAPAQAEPTPVPQQPQEVRPEDLVEDLLKGLF